MDPCVLCGVDPKTHNDFGLCDDCSNNALAQALEDQERNIWKPAPAQTFETLDSTRVIECPICMDDITSDHASFTCSGCLAKIHPTCIGQWWKTKGQKTCPCCQLDMDKLEAMEADITDVGPKNNDKTSNKTSNEDLRSMLRRLVLNAFKNDSNDHE